MDDTAEQPNDVTLTNESVAGTMDAPQEPAQDTAQEPAQDTAQEPGVTNGAMTLDANGALATASGSTTIAGIANGVENGNATVATIGAMQVGLGGGGGVPTITDTVRVGESVVVEGTDFGLVAGIVLLTDGSVVTVRGWTAMGTDTILRGVPRLNSDTGHGWRRP